MDNILYTNKLLDYLDFVGYSDKFIETGSAAGDGIQRALLAGFKEIHSIEAGKSWYDLCCDRFKDTKSVALHYGKSSDVLKETLLLRSDQHKPVVFFLDAHPSGPLSAGHDDVVARGGDSEFTQDNIIKTELGIIFSRYTKPLIIIDDQNGLDECASSYIDIILANDPNYRFEFYDENLSGNLLYKDKILVAIPVEE